MTATAILKLEQQGRLSTSDPISKFFRSAPADKRAITVEQLLHHVSGISGEVGVPYASTVSRDEYVPIVLEPPLSSEPGAKFEYSNAGYALLAAIVEIAAGTSFEEYVRASLFRPAGMTDSGFVRDERLVKSDRVSSRLSDGPAEWTAANWFYGWGYRGMGGVVTTAYDLLKWDRALRGDKVLDEERKRKAYAPGLAGYACGWLVETTDRGTRKAHHSGGVAGYAAQISRWLEDDALVVVLSNGKSDLRAVEKAAANLLFPPAHVEADLDVEGQTLNEYGAFHVTGGLAWDADRDGDSVRLRLSYRGKVVATIRTPLAQGKALADSLEQALSGSRGGPGAEGEPVGGVYAQGYGRGTRLRLEEDLVLRVQPRYVGRDASGAQILEERPVLILEDTKTHAWPVMTRLPASAARALAAALRKATS